MYVSLLHLYAMFGATCTVLSTLVYFRLTKSKLQVFNVMVVPTLLYRCEMWTVQKRHESRLQACEMVCLRRIEGMSRIDEK